MTHICILTVTYGDRWEYLNKIIDYARKEDAVKCLIIVNNASTYDLASKTTSEIKIQLIDCEENLGSANGFNKGLAYFLKERNEEQILLLDDDNLPLFNIEQLVAKFNELYKDNTSLALSCYRLNRAAHVNQISGVDQYLKNSFYNYHFKKTFRKWLMRNKKSNALNATIPYGPYGGLFISRELLKVIGLPKTEMLLYYDDHEFTNRISTLAKGKLILVKDLAVKDLETSTLHSNFSNPEHKITTKTLLAIRNQSYFSYYFYTDNQFIRKINKCIFLCLTWWKIKNKSKMKVLLRAINEGEKAIFNNADYKL